MNILRRKLRGLVHRRLLPRWVQRRAWDEEYATGQWDSTSLHTPDDPIYEVLGKYCVDRDICDVGCGNGNTVTEMPPVYRTYTGVDISHVALATAKKRAAEAGRDRVAFVHGFMHSFTPAKKPDVFLFRETLMYVPRSRSHIEDGMAVFLRRYAAMLAPGGTMIVSLCIGSPPAERFAARVEAVARKSFELIECRRTQQPALLVVFQPSRQ